MVAARHDAMSAVGLGFIEQTVARTGFTDNLDTTGYIDLTDPLPPGALVLGWRCRVTTAFSGDTSAIVSVGVAGVLAAYSADTGQSVFTAGTIRAGASLAASSGDNANAAQTVRVTVTSGADFTNVSAGTMTVTVWYLI